MKKFMTITALVVSAAALTAGCSSSKTTDPTVQTAAEKVQKTDFMPTTTTVYVAPTTTTTTAPAPSAESIWLDSMAAGAQKFLDANKIMQYGNNDAVTCRKALAVYNTITIPAAPVNAVTEGSGDYVLAVKYQREALSSFKESMSNCIQGDLSYMLSYLKLGNEWLQLATDNLS